jgi:cysteine synthase A
MGTLTPAFDSILLTIGRTPLVRLEKLERPGGPRLFAKLEFLGPGGSIFDRAAYAVYDSAGYAGHLTPQRPLVVAGGTDASISLALVCSATGHPLSVVIPRSLNIERRRALTDYGAALHPVDDGLGLTGARQAALELARSTHALLVDLFEGDEIVHGYEPIGREIVSALGHRPALVVCGLDLGAIPTGVARGLLTTPVVAVEPAQARIGSGGTFGAHLLGGLAPGPSPAALDRAIVKQFEAVEDREAWDMAERFTRETGILAGIASGAVLVGALRRATAFTQNADIVLVLPDSGERRFMLAELFR